jgi:hypothetical protein
VTSGHVVHVAAFDQRLVAEETRNSLRGEQRKDLPSECIVLALGADENCGSGHSLWSLVAAIIADASRKAQPRIADMDCGAASICQAKEVPAPRGANKGMSALVWDLVAAGRGAAC